MPEAERLYRQVGFVDIEPYTDDRRPEVRCLALSLLGIYSGQTWRIRGTATATIRMSSGRPSRQ